MTNNEHKTKLSPVSRGEGEVLQDERSPVSRGEGEVPQDERSSVSRGEVEALQDERSPVSREESEALQDERSPVSRGEGEVLQDERSPVSRGEGEVLQDERSPVSSGEGEARGASQVNNSAEMNAQHHGNTRQGNQIAETFAPLRIVGEITGSYSDCSGGANSHTEGHKKKEADKVLDVTGLFALTGEYNAGLAYLAAAIIAVKVINQRPDILPGYTIRINAHDTKCSVPDGLDAFYHEVYNLSRTSIMTMGGTCSHVTEATAQVSDLWGIPEISYSAVSPYLSNQDKFPSFFRVMSPEQYLTSARIKLFKTMGWKKVHTIYQNYFLFSTLDESMRQEMEAAGIQVISSGQIFTDDPTPNIRTLICVSRYYKGNAVLCSMILLSCSTGGFANPALRAVMIIPERRAGSLPPVKNRRKSQPAVVHSGCLAATVFHRPPLDESNNSHNQLYPRPDSPGGVKVVVVVVVVGGGGGGGGVKVVLVIVVLVVAVG
ncbi:GABA type B receptor 1f [Elysia marginata]|uniref:GABA type B receptor 1f n=1 Tax=Elysia marginata TaxID=1093978 RepID=A0AAV4EGD4_9GAST|nr:GABA type B receptor 1f [Elysia marginata]